MTAAYLDRMKLMGMKHYGFGPEEMKKIKVCKSCGAKASSSDRTCSSCGELLSKKTLYDEYKGKHVYCRNCDTVLAKDAQYCPQCGRRIEKLTDQ